jgi:hypothetical protein
VSHHPCGLNQIADQVFFRPAAKRDCCTMSTLTVVASNLDNLTVEKSVLLCTSLIAKQEVAWLALTMPRSLFDGASSPPAVTVLIGATTSDGKNWKCIDNPPSFFIESRLAGEFSSLAAIQKFQKAIIEDWKKFQTSNASQWAKGTTVGKSLTSPSFVAKALKTGFDAIGMTQSAYSGMKLSDWSLSDLKKYAESRKKTFVWRDQKLAAFADVGSAFVELMPDPELAKLEQDAITNPDTNMPARNIDYIRSTQSVGHSGNFAYAAELQNVNLPRVIGFGFRGDSRDPITLKSNFSGAFMPNFTRTDQNAKVRDALLETVKGNLPKVKSDRPAIYTRIENARKLLSMKRTKSDSDQSLQAEALRRVMQDANVRAELSTLFGGSKPAMQAEFVGSTGLVKSFDQMNQGALELGEYVQNEFLGGFVSVSRSVMVAKSFASGRGGNAAIRDGWLYACFVEGAFNMPLKGTHPLAKKQEFEMAMPGMLEWEDVAGWRKVNSSGKFEGAIYLRHSLSRSDPKAFKQLFEYLSGKPQ